MTDPLAPDLPGTRDDLPITGYAVICVSYDGLRVVVDGFSAQDSADDFAKDPRASRYRRNVSAERAAWLFECCQREVVPTVRP